MPGRAEGFVDHHRRLIALSSALEPNGQVAVLVHELAHVHGARYQDFGRAGAEVVAETAAFVALSAAARKNAEAGEGTRTPDLPLTRRLPVPLRVA